jgi:hypothetical protein
MHGVHCTYGVYWIYKHVWEDTQMTVWFVHSYTIFCLLHTKEHNNFMKKIGIHLGIWVSRRSWHTFLAMRIWLRCMCLLYTKDRVTVYKPDSHLGVFPNVFIYSIHPVSTMDAMHTIGHIPVHLTDNTISLTLNNQATIELHSYIMIF